MESKKFSFTEFYKKEKFKDKPKAIAQIVILDLILIAVSAIGLLSLDAYLFGLLLIVLPALFSTIVCLSLNQVGKDYSNKEFVTGFRNYYAFISPYYGCFDVIKGILFSILIGLLGQTLFSFIYPLFVGDEFLEASNELLDMFSSYNLDGVMELLKSNEVLGDFYFYSELVSLSSAILFMILRTGKFVFNLETRSLTSVFGPKRATYVFKSIWKENKAEFRKDFLSQTWYISLVISIVFILGLVLSIILKLEGFCIVIATTSALLVASIFLPRFVFFIEGLTEKNIKIFKGKFRSMINDSLENLNTSTSANENQKKNMEKLLEELDKEDKDVEEEKKEE